MHGPLGLILCILLLAAAAQAEDLSGGLQATYGSTDRDTTSLQTFEQRYRLHYGSSSFADFRYSASAYYRLLSTETEGSGTLRREEIQPEINGTWIAPYWRWNGLFSYRNFRDYGGGNDLEGRRASTGFTTLIAKFPRVYGRYEWLQNVNHLELLGRDTRQQMISGGTNIELNPLQVQYQYNDQTTRNELTGFEQVSRQHLGTANMDVRLLDNLSLSSYYRINHRRDTETASGGTESFYLAQATNGLYADDTTPEFDELAVQPQLIDGTLQAVIPPIDLASQAAHNIGLDFGIVQTIDRIDLYTDTTASAAMRWAVYYSGDNLNWSLHADFASHFFNESFSRYEISLPQIAARYVKIVNQPLPDIFPVQVTEIQGLIRRPEPEREQSTTDHQGSADLRYQPTDWLSAGAGAAVFRRDRSLLQPGRDEDSFNAQVRIRPEKGTSFGAQYFADREQSPGSEEAQARRERAAISADRDWTRTIRSDLSLTRHREFISDVQTRRGEAVRGLVQVKLLPELSTRVDATFSTDRRFTSNDQFDTRSLNAEATMEPLPGVTAAARGTWVEVESRSGAGSPHRRTFYGEAAWAVTSTIRLRMDGSVSEESVSTTKNWDGLLNWTATRKLTLSANARGTRTESGAVQTIELYSLQAIYAWSSATRISAGYSINKYSLETYEESTNVRLSLETRF